MSNDSDNGALVAAIDQLIEQDRAAGIDHHYLMISAGVWPRFKQAVGRDNYRERRGTRFINAYRGIPISIHDEWSWGWDLMRRPAGTWPRGTLA